MKNEKNEGPGNNRSKAFHAYADGEYTLFFDDDDYLIDMNYISKAVKFHIQHPDVSFVGASTFKEYTRINQFKLSFLEINGVVGGREYFLTPEYRKPDTTTTLFKRESLLKMGISNMKMVNDTPVLLRSLLVGNAGFIDAAVGVYRMHGDNITFHCSREFIIENLNEKKVIKKLAIEKFGYQPKDMDDWFTRTSYSTISYFLANSAKKPNDFKSMYNWIFKNCPGIYRKVRSESRKMLLKRKLSRFGIFK